MSKLNYKITVKSWGVSRNETVVLEGKCDTPAHAEAFAKAYFKPYWDLLYSMDFR